MDYVKISESILFKGLTQNEVENLLAMTTCRTRKFNSGVLIAQNGDPVTALMIVIAGIVKAEMLDGAGRVIKIEDIPAPGVIAPAFIFGAKNKFPVNVVAIPDTELLIIEKSHFLKLLKNDERILVNFLDMISNRSQFLSDKIRFLNFRTIKSKLATYILNLAGEGNNILKLDRTQNDLADYFGVARPSIARVLGEMEEMGIIRTRGKNITIIDRDDLTDLTIDL